MWSLCEVKKIRVWDNMNEIKITKKWWKIRNSSLIEKKAKAKPKWKSEFNNNETWKKFIHLKCIDVKYSSGKNTHKK